MVGENHFLSLPILLESRLAGSIFISTAPVKFPQVVLPLGLLVKYFLCFSFLCAGSCFEIEFSFCSLERNFIGWIQQARELYERNNQFTHSAELYFEKSNVVCLPLL